MKFLILLITSFFTLQLSYAQINEIGIFAGGSNLVGDIGATTYISPKDPALGLIYKWNASSRHSWRASIIYSKINGNDNESDDPRRIQRDFNFESSLLEINAGFEFTFLDFDLHDGEKIATPYLFTGISLAIHDSDLYINDTKIADNSSSNAFGIPLGLGFKTNLLNHFILGIEMGARYTFSDNLDASNNIFGNIDNNDWYMFSGITLTYTFGQNACYCR